MSRKIEVEVIADAAGYSRGMKQASHETEGLGHHFSGLAKEALVFAGVGVGVGAVLEESVKAAMNAQVAQASLDAALKATHQSVEAVSPAIEKASAAGRKLGFTDEDTAKAMAKLEIATGSTKKSIQDLSIVQDLSRVKHMDLASAAQTVSMAMTGSQRAAKQLGIVVPPVTAAVDRLKASHENLKTASGALELAHAKLLDKMATGNAVLDAVKAKVQGQAQAYSETAAGAMAQFHAQLDKLEVTLGTALLPAVTRVTQALADGIAWLQQSKSAHEALAAAGQGLSVVFHLIGDAIDAVRAHWTEISADATKAMDTLQAVVAGAVTVITALWDTFGSTLVTFLRTSFESIKQIVTGAFNVIEGLFRLFADVIHGRWGQVWDDVKQIVSGAWSVVEGLFRAALNTLTTVATLIGKSILKAIQVPLEGLVGWIGGLLGQVGGAISGAAGAVAGAAEKFGGAIVHGIGAALSALGGVLTKMIVDPINAVIGLIDSIRIPAFSLHIDTHIPGVGKVGFDYGGSGPLFDIPKLDKGGWVEQTGLAIVHRGETYSGVGSSAMATGGGGGATVNVYVQGALLGSTVPEVAQTIRRELKLHGFLNGDVGLA